MTESFFKKTRSSIFSIFSEILSFLFPREEEEAIILSSPPEKILPLFPRNTRERGEERSAVILYRHPLSKALLRLLKYQKNEKAKALALDLLEEFLLSKLADEAGFLPPKGFLLSPIPMSQKERRERGWNQAEELARELAQRKALRSFVTFADTLSKDADTLRQSSLHSAPERRENIKGAFSCRAPEKVRDQSLIVIDDVTTTGATFSEARRVLREAGARTVFCLALAC